VNAHYRVSIANTALRFLPWLLLGVVGLVFGALSGRFLTPGNLSAILTQSGWLIVVGVGMNFVLLCSGVDLSVGASMYLAAVVMGTALYQAPWWAALLAAMAVGSAVGALNGLFIVKFALPSFAVTLASTFIVRGLGLYLSATKVVFVAPVLAALGRTRCLGAPVPLLFTGAAVVFAWLLLQATSLGLYIRSIGADQEGARKAGVPTDLTRWVVFTVCGAFAGLGGFVLVSQTSAASAGFGQSAEFLAIASAVLGGTSLLGGRGSVGAPILGAVLITTVQDGLAVINADPYVYPVIVGVVIFIAALLDSVRLRILGDKKRRKRPSSTGKARELLRLRRGPSPG
jgi:ribose transport system permease protein